MSFTEKHLTRLPLPFPVCKTSDDNTHSCREDGPINSFGLLKRFGVFLGALWKGLCSFIT